MSALPSSWRDPFGNSFEGLVEQAIAGIVSAAPDPFRYQPDYYPPLVIKSAMQKVESARGWPLRASPRPMTPEEELELEISILEIYTGGDHVIAREGAASAQKAIERIETRHPGTIQRFRPLSWISQRPAKRRSMR